MKVETDTSLRMIWLVLLELQSVAFSRHSRGTEFTKESLGVLSVSVLDYYSNCEFEFV